MAHIKPFVQFDRIIRLQWNFAAKLLHCMKKTNLKQR